MPEAVTGLPLSDPDRRRHLRLLAIGASAGLLGVTPPPVGARLVKGAPFVLPSRYRETFADDFDNGDLARFSEEGTVSVNGAPAWRSRYRHPRKDPINQEKQIYVDAAYAGTGDKPLGINPFFISKGVLSIVAERTPEPLRPKLYQMAYTSGCITTERSFSQQYGYFEMRARLPVGKGFWPSFWLMPVRDAWPPEIDVIEANGLRPGFAHFAVRNPGNKKPIASDWLQVGRPADGWQTFGCEWTREKISFNVDGFERWSMQDHQIHEPMYLLANLALGSHDPGWIPDPDASTPLPARMEIDYIRAFQR